MTNPDNQTEHVLQLARQRIEERKEHEQLMQRHACQHHTVWRSTFVVTSALLLGGLFLTPTMPLDQKMILILQGVCSQENNIVLGGIQFPMCARCSGIYLSALITFLYLLVRGRYRAARMPPWSITGTLAFFVVLMGIDGFNSVFHRLGLPTLYTPMNELRVLTGIGVGLGIGSVTPVVFNLSIRADADEQQPIIQNWREFATLLALCFLLVLIIFGNVTILAWPLALAVFFSTVGIIFVVCLLFTSFLFGCEGNVRHIDQLALPGTVALLATTIFLATFSLLRVWLESYAVAEMAHALTKL